MAYIIGKPPGVLGPSRWNNFWTLKCSYVSIIGLTTVHFMCFETAPKPQGFFRATATSICVLTPDNVRIPYIISAKYAKWLMALCTPPKFGRRGCTTRSTGRPSSATRWAASRVELGACAAEIILSDATARNNLGRVPPLGSHSSVGIIVPNYTCFSSIV